MPVIRIEKTRDYTVMSNHHFRNRNLSLKAKGIMSLMLSLPDDWDYTIAGLAKLSKDGISSVRAALKELEDEGYLKMEQTKAENGKFGKNQYVLYEKPFTENPITEKPAQLNTHISSTYLSSTKESITGADAPEEDEKPKAAEKAKTKEKDPFDVPSPQLRDALKGFADSRKALHKPMTRRAKELIMKRLEQLAPHNEVRQVAILNQSVERGWQGVFDIEQDKRYKGGGSRAAEPKADDLYNEAMGILNQ